MLDERKGLQFKINLLAKEYKKTSESLLQNKKKKRLKQAILLMKAKKFGMDLSKLEKKMREKQSEEDLRRIARLIKRGDAKRVVVLSGAGISVNAGLTKSYILTLFLLFF